MKPQSMRIGSFDWSIEWKNPVTTDAGEAVDGQCCLNEGRIEIDTSNGDHFQRNVLVHETLHALFKKVNLTSSFFKDKGELEEEFIERFSPALLDWLRDNMEVVYWLCKADVDYSTNGQGTYQVEWLQVAEEDGL